jgi:hypothetical protein
MFLIIFGFTLQDFIDLLYPQFPFVLPRNLRYVSLSTNI